MSIQTNSPSTNLGTSVSADEIAVLLGYADAAELVAAIEAGSGIANLTEAGDWPVGLTTTELSYVGDVTSDIQTQINALGGGFTPKYARISRGTSDQTGISGSFAEDYLQYNSEDTDPDGLVSISGDDVTFAAAGTYILLQHVYGMGGGFFGLHVNGSLVDRVQTNGATYEALPRILVTTGANQVVKFTAISSAALTMAYTDSVRTVNFVEILRIA